jgi:hypothetical protein
MKNYQNQLDRFRDIAKRLVDDHSADLFRGHVAHEGMTQVNDAYHNHLDTLGKQLDEQAQRFISTNTGLNENLKSDVWGVCKKYLEQFTKRNSPR